MQWYQLQLVLNDGNRRNPSIVPIDWGYMHALNLSAWNNDVDLVTYAVMVINVVKGIEVSDDGLAPSKGQGWDPHVAAIHNLAQDHLARKYRQIPEATRRAVAEAVLERWVTRCENYSRDQYLAAGHLKETEKNSFRQYLRLAAENLNEIGVSPALVNRLVDFGARMYPSDPWSDVRPAKKRAT